MTLMFDDVIDATVQVVLELIDSLDDVPDAQTHLCEVAKDVVSRTFGL